MMIFSSALPVGAYEIDADGADVSFDLPDDADDENADADNDAAYTDGGTEDADHETAEGDCGSGSVSDASTGDDTKLLMAEGYNYVPGEGDIESIADYPDDADGFMDLVSDEPLPSSYRTPELPPLRNQNPYGTCWAHSMIACAEISMMKQGLELSPDYSELHLSYFTYNTPSDPTGRMSGDRNGANYSGERKNYLMMGGNHQYASKVLAAWIGAADEETAPYSDAEDTLTSGLPDSIAYIDKAHIKNCYSVGTTTEEDRNAIKRMVMDLGAAGISYYNDKSGASYSEANNSYYYSKSASETTHAVTIVGWDDEFPSYKFRSTPAGNGAWLIRNSWYYEGLVEPESYYGYFWMSYYDKGLALSAAWGYEYDYSDDYDHNYQYDGGMQTFFPLGVYSPTVREANVFEVPSGGSKEVLRAAGFTTENTNVNYTIEIYKNPDNVNNPASGTLASTTHGKTTYAGYYTVPLAEEVNLNPGDKFSIVLTLDKSGDNIKIQTEYSQNSGWMNTTAKANSGQSFISYISDGEWSAWRDVTTINKIGNVRVKAFSTDESDIQPTVTFDPNGGSCNPESKIVTYRKQYGALPEAERDGYTFAGWFTGRTDGTEVTSRTKVTDQNDHTLYAHWTPKKYKVSFDANGGSCDTEYIEVTYDSLYGELPSAVREGYNQQGWFTEKSGGTEIKSTDTVNITSDTTLYAQWTGKDIRVDFDAAGGTCDPEYITVHYKSTYGTLPVPEKPGHDFLGWYIDETTAKKTEASTRVDISDDHTLHARWQVKDYGVVFDPNGGSCDTELKTVTYGEKYGTLPNAERENYIFAGWFTDPAAGEEIKADTVFTAVDDQTLYAHWTGKPFKVLFYADNAECDPGYKTVRYGEPYGELPVPVRDGCEFIGWFTSMIGGTRVTAASIVQITSPKTLYARWDTTSYTIYFNPNAEDATCPCESQTVDSGGTYGALPVAVREGFAFAGWYTAPEGGTWITASTPVTITADQTLYAHWMPEPDIVTFDADGGEVSPDKKDVWTGLPYGELPTPVYKGYDFAGWFINLTDAEPVTEDTIVSVTGDHTLHAKWRGAPYTVSFDARGGTPDYISKIVYFRDVYGELPGAVLEGYDFLGWYTSITGGEHIRENTAVTITSGQALYAHWKKQSYTVTLDGNGGNWNGVIKRTLSKEWGSAIRSDELEEPSYDRKHKFTGWYKNSAGTEPFGPTEQVTGAFTLYAGWDDTGALDYDGFIIEGLDGTFGYTGSAIKPKISVYYGDYERELTEGTDYTVSYRNNVNAADRSATSRTGAITAPAVTVTGKGNYTGSVTETFTIGQIPMSRVYTETDSLVESGITDANYILPGTGKSQKVSPVFYAQSSDGRTITLKKGTDYTLSREEFKDSGTYVVKVAGAGNFRGERDLVVRVRDVAPISRVSFPAVPDQVYDRGLQYILAGLADDGQKRAVDQNGIYEWRLKDPVSKYELEYGKDYVLAYDSNSDAGTANVTVIGKGSYAGTVKRTFRINGIAMKNVAVSGDASSVEYTGEPVKIAGSETGTDTGGVTLTYKTTGAAPVTLIKGTDYTVSYTDNIMPGTASVIYTGKGRCSGTIKKTFKIKSLDIAYAGGKIEVRWPDNSRTWTASTVPEYDCSKAALKPQPVVIYSYNGKDERLAEGKDYALSWSNNAKPGAYSAAKNAPTVTIAGKGRFTGNITRTFTINGGRFGSFAAGDVAYQKDKAGLFLKTKTVVKDTAGVELKAGTDYYALNDKKKPADFRFVSFDFDDTKETGQVMVKSGKNWVAETVSKGDKADSSWCILPGTCLDITVYGKGIFEGQEASARFVFAANDFSKVTASIPDVTYTGRAVTADDIRDGITAEYRIGNVRQQLVCGADYDIAEDSFVNSINAGTAKVTLIGNPARGFAGEKTVSFRIAPEKMNCTINYEGNTGDADNGLIKALIAADPDGRKTYSYYSTHYRITGTMKPSSTPLGGKLSKSSFKVQKFDGKKWVSLPASLKISVKGWTADSEGDMKLYADGAEFLPSWTERLVNRGNNWTLYAQWEVGK